MPTESSGHAARLASDAVANGCDLVVVHGGDGTINEAVQGMAGSTSATLFPLPGGTANVLAREVGFPEDPVRVARMLPALVARTVRLGLVEPTVGESRYFVLMCGAGIDAAISARVGVTLKNRLGQGAFWLRGAEQLFRGFPRVTARRIGGAGPDVCSLVVISKSRQYGGGLVLTPDADLLSNHLEIARFTGTSRTQFCGYLLAAACGITARWPGIDHQSCSEFTLSADPEEEIPFHVDGEPAGVLPAVVSLSGESLRMLLPSDYPSTRRKAVR